MLKTDWAELLTPTINLTSLLYCSERRLKPRSVSDLMPVDFQPRFALLVMDQCLHLHPQQTAHLSLCFKMPNDLVEWALFFFLFTNGGFKLCTLKILPVSVLFVFSRACRTCRQGTAQSSPRREFFQQHFGIQGQEWSAQLTLAVYKFTLI